MAIIDINWTPSRRELKQFVGIWFPAFFGVVGGLALYHTGSPLVAACIWGPAVAVSLLGFFVPQLARALFVAWMCAAYPIGWLISHLLLASVFYLVITPSGIFMRLVGRDPLQRRFDRSATSYWVPRNSARDPARYFRQF